MMNDEQLLELLQNKTPDELTLEEITQLHAQLQESPQLLEQLRERLDMEQYLTQALARVDVSADAILKPTQSELPPDSGFIVPAVLFIVSLALIGFISTVIWLAIRGPSDDAVADADGNQPAQDAANDPDQGEATQANDNQSEPDDPPEENDPSNRPDEPEPQPVPPDEPHKEDPPQPAPPPQPWDVGLAAPPTAWADLWHQDFDISKKIVSKDDVEQWFGKVPGQNSNFNQRKLQNINFGLTGGIVKLNSPWPEDGILRLSLARQARFRMHFWSGEKGVSIYSLPEGDPNHERWAAYLTTREGDKPQPKTFRLADSDDARDAMCEVQYGPVLLLRWQEGELVMTRGDVELVSASLPAPPKEVYIEGEVVYRGLAMQRVKDLPPRPAPLEDVDAITFEKPAELDWHGEVPEKAERIALDSGGLQLKANRPDQVAWLATKLPPGGPRLIELELTDIAPGTGVYLGPEPQRDGAGEIVRPGGVIFGECLTFVRDGGAGQHTVFLENFADQRHAENLGGIDQRVLPKIGDRVWVRMLVGVGWNRCWISPNGRDWTLLFRAQSWFAQPLTHVGVFANKAVADGGLTVQRITLRPLPTINSLADDEIMARAGVVPDAPNIGQWLVAITEAQPPGVDTAAWRRACALRTLGDGSAPKLGVALLDRLLNDPVLSDWPLEQRLALLSEASLLAPQWEKLPGDVQFNLPGRYWQLAEQTNSFSDPAAYTTIAREMMVRVPQRRQAFKALDPILMRRQLLHLTYAGEWEELDRTLAGWRLYLGDDQLARMTPSAIWADMASSRQDGPAVGSDRLARPKAHWRHPMIEEYSKEAYNVAAELNAAIESAAWDDAARIVSSLTPEASLGLLPAPGQRDLLRSMRTTIDSAMRKHTEFPAAMNEQYGKRAQFRIRQAIADGNAAAVQAATVQFQGTAAVSEAYRWLGDRALSGGDFGIAVTNYRRSLADANPLAVKETSARMRLAAAMMGQELGEPADSTVRFGEVTMTAQEFEALIAEMIATHGTGQPTESAHGNTSHVASLPKHGGFKPENKSRVDGDVGGSHGSINTHVRQLKLPWQARQYATQIQDDVLYVNNRFHVSAFQLSDGKRLWKSPSPPHGAGPTHHWQHAAMRPLVVGNYVWTRMLSNRGPVLACLRRDNGQMQAQMSYTPSRGEVVLSDPVLRHGRLLCLTLVKQHGDRRVVRLASFDPGSGSLITQQDLLPVREHSVTDYNAVVTTAGDAYIAALGGVVMSYSAAGELNWVRRQGWLASELEPTWLTQRYDPPLVAGDYVLVTQPRVRAIECIDTATGSLKWRTALPKLRGVLGVVASRLVATHGDELLALNVDTGVVEWRRPFEDVLGGELIASDGLLLTRRAVIDPNQKKHCPELVWLDGEGQTTATTRLESLVAEDPRLGPMVWHGDKLWTFYGKAENDPHRDVVLLSPEGEAEQPIAAITATDDHWNDLYVLPRLEADVARRFPGWHVLAANEDPNHPHAIDAHGESDVIRLHARGNQPIVLARHVTVPKNGRPHLNLHFGSEANQNWKLEVSFAGDVLKEQDFEWGKKPEVWKKQRVDLKPIAGKSGWLVVRGDFVSGGEHTRTYWQRLDVGF